MAVLRTMAAVVVAVTCTEAALQQPQRDGRPLQQSPSALLTQAHDHYKAQQWQRAVEKYEAALAIDGVAFNAWFFLANSYDNLYTHAPAGDPYKDENLRKAVEHYRTAAERDTDPRIRERALEYLLAVYGPGKLDDPRQAEPIVLQMIQMEPENAANYLGLAKILEDSGRYEEARQNLLRASEVAPRSVPVYSAIAGFYNRQGDFPGTMKALHRAAELEPENADAHYKVAAFYMEKSFHDHRLTREQKLEYVASGIAATERAIALRPDHVDALTYRNFLLRMQANEEADPDQQARLIAEADALRERAIELGKERVRRGVVRAGRGSTADPPSPPRGAVDVDTPGDVPKRVTDVPPIYPPEALAAKVEGVVLVEASIDAHGRVADARVLRSIPLLDRAALDAVRQWEFEPTYVNGVPVPIAATVTVNFSLP